MIGRRSGCARHRPALTHFVDRGERTAGTAAALEHLGRCRRCEEEVTEIALTIVALRRLGRDVRGPVPPMEPPLPAGAGRPRLRWSLRAPAAGPLLSMLAVVLLLVPIRLGTTPVLEPSALPSRAELAGTVPAARSATVHRRYEPALQPLTREVVLGFLRSSPSGAPGRVRSVPVASDRAAAAEARAHVVRPATTPAGEPAPAVPTADPR